MQRKNIKSKRSYFTSPKKEPLVKKMILDPHQSIPPVSCFDLRPIHENESNQQDIIFDPKSSSLKEISDFQKNSPHEFDKIIYGLSQQNGNENIFLNHQRSQQFSNQLSKEEQQPNQSFEQNSNSFKRYAPLDPQTTKKYQNLAKIYQSLDQSQQFQQSYYRISYAKRSPSKKYQFYIPQIKRNKNTQSGVKLQEQEIQRDQNILIWPNQQLEKTVEIEKAWPKMQSPTPHQSKKKSVKKFTDNVEFELINQYTELISYTSLIEDLITVYDKSPLFETPLDFDSDPDETNHNQEFYRPQSKNSIQKEKSIPNDSLSHEVKIQELSMQLDELRFDSDGSQSQKNDKEFFTLMDKMRIDEAPESKKNTVKKQILFQRSKTYLNFYEPIQEIKPFIKKMGLDEKVLFLQLKKQLKQIKDIIEYFDKKKNSQKKEHVCKICGEQFESGRQLGGHMSRKHPGKALEYLFKKELRKVKEIERNRRKYFKNPKKELKHDEQGIY